jgi:hypothetical protein
MSDEKWIMFKNYMHNELGITQQDIRQWIKESVDEVAKRMVNNEFDKFNVKQIVSQHITEDDGFYGRKLKERIIREVSKQLTKKFELKLKD